MAPRLRRPYDHEASDCARLLHISAPHVYSYTLTQTQSKLYELLQLFFRTPGNMHSKENMIVEEEDGRITGMILACPARDMKRLASNTARCLAQLIRIAGLRDVVRMMLRLPFNRYLPVTEGDGLFVANLAVFEEYRGRGVAVRLLQGAQAIAVEKGLGRLTLVVEIDNSHARRVYEKFGFMEVKRIDFPSRYHKYGLFGYYKMVKDV
ncbi:MAG: GNAT family N-acetyltransferase [Firmicutes bacterium]|jgi:ribosomal protein S18 acetylase RimI-like enzyme|nr:GNAT family N-acetyltransferase [Bacillota bacterium]